MTEKFDAIEAISEPNRQDGKVLIKVQADMPILESVEVEQVRINKVQLQQQDPELQQQEHMEIFKPTEHKNMDEETINKQQEIRQTDANASKTDKQVAKPSKQEVRQTYYQNYVIYLIRSVIPLKYNY